jgi:hypothetical protein
VIRRDPGDPPGDTPPEGGNGSSIPLRDRELVGDTAGAGVRKSIDQTPFKAVERGRGHAILVEDAGRMRKG